MKDRSFGVIPMRRVGDLVEVLMIQHQAGHWGFPKGHPDPSENPRETARRELLEETGLKVRSWISPRAFSEEYQFERNGKQIQKEVSYFPAFVYGELVLQGEEISDALWLPLSKLTIQATFSEMRILCEQFIVWMMAHESYWVQRNSL